MTLQNKTATIKKRRVEIYLPTEEMRADWKERAKKSGIPLSQFVQEHVENSLNQEEENTFKSRRDLINRIQDLEMSIGNLEKDNRHKSLLVDRLESELRQYRARPFLESPDLDKMEYEPKLIELLKSKGTVKEDDIYMTLNLNKKDNDFFEAIHKQLEQLAKFGLVSILPNGWRWLG